MTNDIRAFSCFMENHLKHTIGSTDVPWKKTNELSRTFHETFTAFTMEHLESHRGLSVE